MGRVYTSGDQFSTDMIKDLFLKMYPVGSIYLSVNSTNPASLFGGTWERIKDRFLLAAGDTYAAGETGGAATHKHTTQGHTLTINEMPAHNHGVTNPGHYFYDSSGDICVVPTSDKTYQWKYFNTSIQNRGGGGSHSHGDTGNASSLPPYLAVYVWKRTA